MSKINNQVIADTMVAALEGGSNYWIEAILPIYPTAEAYSTPEAYGPDMTERRFLCDGAEATLNWPNIQQGLLDKYPHHYADMAREEGDPTTGDVLLQCCLFGDIVYG